MLALTAFLPNLEIIGKAASFKNPERQAGDAGVFASIMSEAQSKTAGPANAENTGAGTGAKTGGPEDIAKNPKADEPDAEAETTAIPNPYITIPITQIEQNPSEPSSEEPIPAAEMITPASAEQIPAAETIASAGTADAASAEIVNPPVTTTAETPKEIPKETPPVISILEGDMDIDAPKPNPDPQTPADAADVTAEAGDRAPAEELTARMPQTAGPLNASRELETGEEAVLDDGDSLCPLENENDAVQKTGSQKSYEPEGQEDQKGSKPSDSKYSETVFTRQTVDISP